MALSTTKIDQRVKKYELHLTETRERERERENKWRMQLKEEDENLGGFLVIRAITVSGNNGFSEVQLLTEMSFITWTSVSLALMSAWMGVKRKSK